jgi:dolichol kinase
MGINFYRKLFHICFGIFLLILNHILSKNVFGVILIFFFLGLSVFEFLRLFFFEKVPLKFLWVPLLKKEEFSRLNDAWFYLIGIGLAWYFLNVKNFQMVLSILTFADPGAALVGFYIGRIRLFNSKSIEGTFAFFFISLGIVYFFTQSLNFFYLGLCLTLSLVELFVKRDNLWIPLAATFYLKLFI